MIGRGTRLHPGKESVIIVDIVDATREHRLTTLPSLFGLSEKFDLEGRTTDEAEKAIQWVASNRPMGLDVRAFCRYIVSIALKVMFQRHP